jgi:hypothetical protein
MLHSLFVVRMPEACYRYIVVVHDAQTEMQPANGHEQHVYCGIFNSNASTVHGRSSLQKINCCFSRATIKVCICVHIFRFFLLSFFRTSQTYVLLVSFGCIGEGHSHVSTIVPSSQLLLFAPAGALAKATITFLLPFFLWRNAPHLSTDPYMLSVSVVDCLQVHRPRLQSGVFHRAMQPVA